MFVRKEQRKPFRPSAGYKALIRECESQISLESLPIINHLSSNNSANNELSSINDAETGESLSLTKSRWTPKEGRLTLTASTIIKMGTGKLDIKQKQSLDNEANANATSTVPAAPSRMNSLVENFLLSGPLTPMYHTNWNKLTNEINYAKDDHSSSIYQFPSVQMSDLSINSPEFSTSLFTKATGGIQVETETDNSVTRSVISMMSRSHRASPVRALQPAIKVEIPSNIALSNAAAWEALQKKLYNDLYKLAEQMEKNKSLTRQDPFPGGWPGLRRACRNLANLKLNQMRELVQAVDDEATKEQKRENAERANFDKPKQLSDLKKIHGEERRVGRQYLVALQRDQEIIFMTHFHELGFLW